MYAYQFCVHLRISTTISDVIYIFVAVVLYAASTPKSLSEVSSLQEPRCQPAAEVVVERGLR